MTFSFFIIIKKVKRAKEINAAFQDEVMRRLRRNVPRIIINQVRYSKCLPVFKKMYLLDTCSRGQLGLLSTLFEEKHVPQVGNDGEEGVRKEGGKEGRKEGRK